MSHGPQEGLVPVWSLEIMSNLFILRPSRQYHWSGIFKQGKRAQSKEEKVCEGWFMLPLPSVPTKGSSIRCREESCCKTKFFLWYSHLSDMPVQTLRGIQLSKGKPQSSHKAAPSCDYKPCFTSEQKYHQLLICSRQHLCGYRYDWEDHTFPKEEYISQTANRLTPMLSYATLSRK